MRSAYLFVLCYFLIPNAVSASDDPVQKSLEYVKKLGGVVRTQEPELRGVRVSCRFDNEILGVDDIKEMAGLKSCLTSIELVNGTITPEAILLLNQFTELRFVKIDPQFYDDETLLAFKKGKCLWLLQWAYFDKQQNVPAVSDDSILSLTFGPKITDAGLEVVAGLKKLRELDIQGSKITDEGLKTILKIKSLRSLSLDFDFITKKNVSQWEGFEKLTYLSLSKSDTDDQTITDLAGLKNLQSLDLSETRISDNCIPDLLKLKNLEYLNLQNTAISGEGFEKLADLKSLRNLHIGRSQISDEVVFAFEKLKLLHCLPAYDTVSSKPSVFPEKSVTYLNLENANVSGAGLKKLLQFASITRIACHKTQLTDDWFRVLIQTKRLPDLQSLSSGDPDPSWDVANRFMHFDEKLTGLDSIVEINMQHWKLSGEGFAELRHLPNLKTIIIGSMGLDETVFTHLSKVPKLEKISLRKILIDPTSYSQLAKSKSLSQIIFDTTDIPQEAFDALGKLPELKVLIIKDCQIAANGFEPLKKLENLEELCLHDVILDQTHLKSLPNLTRLKWLDLRSTNILDGDLKFISSLTNLEHLDLRDCAATPEGLKHLVPLKKLKLLSLKRSTITDEMIKAIHPNRILFEAIVANCSKLFSDGETEGQFLMVHLTSLTDKSLIYLKDFPQSKYLYLSNEQASVEGLKHLKDFPKLESVWITNPTLTDEKLAQLKAIPKLNDLVLIGVSSSEETRKRLQKALGDNVSIRFQNYVGRGRGGR